MNNKIIRQIDDAGLDVYQFRMVMHILRVGECWESLRTTADKCGMSLGKASQVRGWLLQHGWLKKVITERGQNALVVCSPHEQKCSPDEQECSPHEHEQNVLPPIKCSPHEPKLSIPNEGEYITQLEKHFTNVAGVFPGRGNYDDMWAIPLQAMLQQAGDIERAQERITKAVEFARGNNDNGRKYTVSNPKSIATIYANMNEAPKEAIYR